MQLFFKKPPEHTKYYNLNSAPFTDLYNIYKGKINRLLSGCFVTFIPPSCYLSSVPSNINISFSGLTTSCLILPQGSVNMTPGRLLPRSEFTPVPLMALYLFT